MDDPIEFKEELDDAIEQGIADQLLGRKIYHGEMIGSYGTIVKVNGSFYIKGKVKCTHKGCRKSRIIYFGSGCHHGAFCYAFNPKNHQYLGDFRNQEFRCPEHL